ncbi:hypothetical protein [Synechococcus sp. CS-1328]|uniref:hypothetical protein n=1 Tax=Synechococcus sp. CS-1328 TaxID=2847976 RepID=UPI00223B5D6E|nr:hypothetical protein [Synechococcus sp. CS-1328]MCT0223572.1 hypothetical protein [Synechococcus sp. CS-1328]
MSPTDPAAGGPLLLEELESIESTLLPVLDRHHLRLLAHGLRTFQTIAGRQHGPLPQPAQVQLWVRTQPVLAADADFAETFLDQLGQLGQQLEALARQRACMPLDLTLEDLIGWSCEQATARLSTGSVQ